MAKSSSTCRSAPVLAASGGGPGGEILRKSGAVDVLSPGKPGLPLPFPDGGADVVVGAMPTGAVGDDRQRATLLSDIRRIMRPDGMCILRATALALEGVAVGGSLRAADARTIAPKSM